MKLEYDNMKILKILNAFSNCTNLIASLHFDKVDFNAQSTTGDNQIFENGNSFDTKATADTHFCKYIHQDYIVKCQRNDRYYKDLATKEKRTIIYSCHAGICESITPVIYEGVVMGHLMCGMFVDAEGKYSTEEKVRAAVKKYNLDEEKALSLYRQLPVHTMRHVKDAITILNICISHILEKHFISIKNESLSERLKAYIEQHLAEELTVDLLCREFLINRQKLYTIFKTQFKTGMKEYVIQERLKKAQELLKSTDKSIVEIAQEVGFSDYNYFIRRFRKNVGVSPLRYRKGTEKK